MDKSSFETRKIPDVDPLGAALSRQLGRYSLGVGLAELLAPHAVARLIGARDRHGGAWLLRAIGLRQLATGATLLAAPPTQLGPWLHAAGDAADLAALSLVARRTASRPRTFGAIAVVAGIATVAIFAGIHRARRRLGAPIKRAVTIARPAHEVYAFFRDLRRLPEFMSWVQSVRDTGNGMAHWIVTTPSGARVEYDTEIVEDVPGRRIAWRSLPGASVPNRGTVTLLDAPGYRGTEVVLELRVAAPLACTIASTDAQGDLRRLKQVLETGEIVVSDASIHHGRHPAQPPMRGGLT